MRAVEGYGCCFGELPAGGFGLTEILFLQGKRDIGVVKGFSCCFFGEGPGAVGLVVALRGKRDFRPVKWSDCYFGENPGGIWLVVALRGKRDIGIVE